MIAEVQSLGRFARLEQPPERAPWLGLLVLSVAADFVLLYSQIEALSRQRAGLGYAGECILFVGALVAWYLSYRRLSVITNRAFTARTSATLKDLVQRLQRLPLIDYEALGRGRLANLLVDDSHRLLNAGAHLVRVLQTVLRMAVSLVFMMNLSPTLGRVGLVGIVGLLMLAGAEVRAMRRGYRSMAADQDDLRDLLRGHARGATQIRLHGPRSRAISDAFGRLTAALRQRRVDLVGQYADHRFGSLSLLYALLGINAFFVPLFADVGSETIREINFVLLWVMTAVFGLVYSMPELSQAQQSLLRLQTLDARLTEARLEPIEDGAPAPADDFEELSVHDLSFSYPTSADRGGFTVGPIDVSLRRGEIIFVCGANGSGKSTFLKMLTGLYRPAGGEIRVDGRPIPSTGLGAYRSLFSTIFTDNVLFDRAFGVDPETARRRGHALLEEMEIADKTRFDGERLTRIDLSTGQRKRLAMVLAQLGERPVVVLDEWAADQDPGFRARFYHDILPRLRDAGRLVIAVTHDDQYFPCADRLLEFEYGRLIERAPPEAP